MFLWGSENFAWMVKMLQLRSCCNLDPDPLFQEAPMGAAGLYKVQSACVEHSELRLREAA